MENMTFYDLITFVIDFIGVRRLFQNSFHSFLKPRRKYDFMTLNGHNYDYICRESHSIVCSTAHIRNKLYCKMPL